MHKPEPSIEEKEEVRQFLKECPYTLFDTVWTPTGNGQGFYGITLKKEQNYQRTSSTANKVIKKDLNGNILCEYDTIAKAAEVENMCTAKMSRSIKSQVIFGKGSNKYYYEKKIT